MLSRRTSPCHQSVYRGPVPVQRKTISVGGHSTGGPWRPIRTSGLAIPPDRTSGHFVFPNSAGSPRAFAVLIELSELLNQPHPHKSYIFLDGTIHPPPGSGDPSL